MTQPKPYLFLRKYLLAVISLQIFPSTRSLPRATHINTYSYVGYSPSVATCLILPSHPFDVRPGSCSTLAIRSTSGRNLLPAKNMQPQLQATDCTHTLWKFVMYERPMKGEQVFHDQSTNRCYQPTSASNLMLTMLHRHHLSLFFMDFLHICLNFDYLIGS